MDLFDKLGQAAKTVARTASDKVEGTMEISRLRMRITTERGIIASLKEDLGDYFYDQFTAGMEVEGDAKTLCDEIRESYEAIAEMEARTALLKARYFDEVTCTACGAALDTSCNFCSVCGAKVELPPEEVLALPSDETPPVCPGCGETVAAGQAFCSKCGQTLQ